MQISISKKNIFPENVENLLRALHRADFFSYSLLVGSWAMLIYKEVLSINYTLRTLDIDFALEAVSQNQKSMDLEKVFAEMGFLSIIDYNTGLKKFTKKGFEIEFLMHRRGGTDVGNVYIKNLNINAMPLPFIDLLFQSTYMADFGDYVIRVPCPESMFLHKLIISQRRQSSAKRLNDLEQCKVLSQKLDIKKLQGLYRTQKMSKKTRKSIELSCSEIDFPPHFMSA